MHNQIKRYNIVIRGRVQDIGLRELITELANFQRIKGFVFNDIDGSVKLVAEGAGNVLDNLIEDIKAKTKDIGAEIETIVKREVSTDIDLPPRFVKIPSTEWEEIGRKLDIGIEILRGIKGEQEKLVKGQETLIKSQEALLKGQGVLVKGQETMIKGQEKMINILEKIEKKL